MRARRVDANQGDIKAAFEALGCTVLDLSRVGQGCPDLLIGCGLNVLVEVKTKNGKHTPQQERFNAEWKGVRFTVRDLEGVETVVRYMRKLEVKC